MTRPFQPHTITDDSAVGGQIIQGSTIFNSASISNLKRVPSSGSNRKTFTISTWVKRGKIGAATCMFNAYDGGSSRRFQLAFNSSDALYYNQGGSASSGIANSNHVFRDVNAWYHIVFVADYTNGTAANRIKMYVNGSQISLNISDDVENASGQWNGAWSNEIGVIDNSGNPFDGQMTQIHMIDGQALDPSYFGYTDFQTGIWRPKKYTYGNYGTNGFYLPLDGSNPIGKDMSGKGNDWTPNNLGTVPLYMATGTLPILNTNEGGTIARAGVRPDPFASNIVLALPLSSIDGVGSDVHHLVKGSGSAKSITTFSSHLLSNPKDKSAFYGTSGSAYFAGSQYFQLASSADYGFGTGDFTIELYFWRIDTNLTRYLLESRTSGDTSGFYLYFNNASGISFGNTGGLGLAIPYVRAGQWNHIAIVRQSNVTRIFLNGAQRTSGTDNFNYATKPIFIGQRYSSGERMYGYMQDMRIYKGVAKYTENFTPASTDSSVIPDSPSGIAVSRKFEPSLSGSVGFEGTTSYLKLDNHSDFEVTNQDFCFEAFIYPTGTSQNGFGYLFNKGFHNQITFRNNNNDPQMEVYFASAGSQNYDIAAGFASGNGSVPLNQWTHVALTRSSGTLKWFINGIEKASQSAGAVGTNSTDFTIATYLPSASNYEFKGSISNVRITVGEAVYTSNFTTPTEPLTLTSQGVTSSNVKLLCCKDKLDSTVAEKIPTGSITRFNSAYATATSPFGDDTISRAGGYPVLNILLHRRAGTVTKGNLFLARGNYTLQKSSIIFGPGNITTGKYYWEIDYSSGVYGQYAGITGNFDQGAGEIALQANKSYAGTGFYKLYNQTSGVSITDQGAGTIGYALDVDNRVMTVYYNNNYLYSDTSIPNATTTHYAPFIHSTNDGQGGTVWRDAHFNFGQRPFRFTPPDGYETISIANIPVTPNITDSNDLILKPNKFFHTFQYSGNGGSSKTHVDLPFKPDLIWHKSMSGGYHNRIWDSVRGWHSSLFTNQDVQENYYYDYGQVLDIGPDHVKFGQGNHSNNYGNINGHAYINWSWKAGTPEVPTSGSVYFDGNNDYLTVPKSTDLDFPGEFTMEGWILANSLPSENKTIFESIDWNGQLGQYQFGVSTGNKVQFYVYNNANTYIYGTTTLTPRRWYHLAVSRDSSSNIRLFVNGVLENTTNNNYALSNSNQPNPARIGATKIGNTTSGASNIQSSLNGYISNVRVIKGTALYTSNFTPSTTPLTNVTNTKLLCCQSTTSATTAAVSPTSISTNGNAEADISQNPFDAFSIDGIGYTTAAAATAATSSNLTAGNISISKASVNTEAGFSIIMYTGSGGQGNIPHGLLQDPDMIVVKGITNNNGYWQTWHSSFGTGGTVNRVYWNSNSSNDPSANNMFKVNPGAGTILLNTGDHFYNSASHQYIMYCWHSVPGYSKFDQYYGNGQSSDGKFVYTGFRPAFVFLKRTSGSGNNWEQRDNVRNPRNPADSRLFANTGDTPSVGEGVDFLSNGFKVRNGGNGSNANDQTYLYMAIAEQPLTSPFGTQSNAR